MSKIVSCVLLSNGPARPPRHALPQGQITCGGLDNWKTADRRAGLPPETSSFFMLQQGSSWPWRTPDPRRRCEAGEVPPACPCVGVPRAWTGDDGMEVL